MQRLSDRSLIYIAAFLRALAVGMIGVLLGLSLARLEFSESQIGWCLTSGMAGGALASLLVTLGADRCGRRRALVILGVLASLGAAILALVSDATIVGAAAFLGMVNGMGRDRGAAVVLEQAILPSTTTDAGRTRALAVYNLLQDAGHALGALLAGLPALIVRCAPSLAPQSDRMAVGLYAIVMAIPAFAYLRLTSAVELGSRQEVPGISPRTKRVLWKISSLFAMDSLGGGFLTTALLSFFFFRQFGVNEWAIGVLFFFARVANALSHLAAAWLASRIGLVNTMVFTHIPSSLLLMTVPWAPSFPVAALLFLLREGLVEMDVPTRQSFVLAVVQPH